VVPSPRWTIAWPRDWFHRAVAATIIPLLVAYIATLFTRLR
jgi:hypothetical protein